MDTTTIVLIYILSSYGLFVLTATLTEYASYLKNRRNTEKPDRSGLGMRIFASFSAIRSLKAIFQTNTHSSELRVIHGIRTLSIAWIIAGHIFSYGNYVYPWRNQLEIYGVFDNFLLQPFAFDTIYAVTSFFVLSGFLVTYLFIQRSVARYQCPNIFGYFIFRYFRLTPPLLLLILFLAGPYYYMNKGPVWPLMYDHNLKDCRHQWWRIILYIQNFASVKVTSFPQGWYLSADTQLYVFAPIILYPLYRKPILGVMLMCALFAGTTIASTVQIASTGQSTFFGKHSNVLDVDNFVNRVYKQTYYNAPSYMIGMAAGYLVFLMQKSRITLLKKIIFPCWICSITILSSITFGTFPYFNGTSEMSPWLNVVYGIFARQAWALAVSWIILACSLGHGGPVNWLLTQAPFVILGRLTYCAYLVHIPIIEYYFYGQKDNLHFSIYNMFMIFVANFVMTIVTAVMLAVLVEMPILDALKQLGLQYDKQDLDSKTTSLHFSPEILQNTTEIQQLMIDDSSQDETEDVKN